MSEPERADDETVADAFRPQTPGGFPPQTPGGFPPQTPGGFPPQTPGGFPPQTPGAFPYQAPGAVPGGSATHLPGSGTGLDAPTWAALSGSGERSRLPAPNDLVGPYRVERELARGGMGAVYVAHHVHMGRMVALKLMLTDRADSPKAVERFQIEAEAVARLRHPGIVGVHEAGFHGFSPYMAMEFVQGESLKGVLEREGRLEPGRAVELTILMADAMAHAHEQGILHRDLKPDNVLLADGVPKITDFGLAKQLQDASRESLTKTGQTMGTPGYMAPEQAAGERHDFGFPTDVWGLGATLYALLTGEPPFRGETSVQVITKILTKDPQPPSAHTAIDPALDRIVLTCLEKEVGDRYPTMQALAGDLRRHQAGDAVTAGPTRAQRRRRRRVLALVAALGLVATGGTLAALHHARRTATLSTQQAEHARQATHDRARQSYEQLTATGAADVAALTAWLGDHEASLGDDPLVDRVRAQRDALQARIEAEPALQRWWNDPNMQQRHLQAAEWLSTYDRPEHAAALADLVTKAREFHAQRWLTAPLRRVRLEGDGSLELRTFVGDTLGGEVWGLTSRGRATRYDLPQGDPIVSLHVLPGTAEEPLMPVGWSRRGDDVWHATSTTLVVRPLASLRARTERLQAEAADLEFAYECQALAVDPAGRRALAAGGQTVSGVVGEVGWIRWLERGSDGALIAGARHETAGLILAATALANDRFATVGGSLNSAGTEVLLWAHGHDQPLGRHELGNRGESVAASPDGRVLAVGTSHRGVLLLDVSPSGELTERARLQTNDPDSDALVNQNPYAYGVAFHGDHLVASLHRQAENRFNAVSGVMLWRWPELRGDQPAAAALRRSSLVEGAADEGLALTPDGRFVIQPDEYGSLVIWDGPGSLPQALRAE